MKILCGNNVGFNVDEIVAWKLVKHVQKNHVLNLFFKNNDNVFYVSQNEVGSQSFARLHKLLIDRFSTELGSINSLSYVEQIEVSDLGF